MGIDIRISIDLTPWQKKIMRGAVVTATVIAAFGIGVALAGPIDTSWIGTGQALNATKLLGDLNGLQAEITGDGGVQGQTAQVQAATPLVTAWTTYTPTITSGSNAISATNASGYYRRVGDTIEINTQLTVPSTCTAGGQLQLSFPSGITPDDTKVYGFANCGSASIYDVADTGLVYTGVVDIQPSGTAYLDVDSTAVNGLTCASADGLNSDFAVHGFVVRAHYSFPVTGWTVTGP